MRYCPGNDRASGTEFPFQCHLSTAIAAVASVAATAVAADCFFQWIRDASLAVAGAVTIAFKINVDTVIVD